MGVSSDSLEVITRVGEEKAGEELNQVILSVGVGGERHRLEWCPCPDPSASMLDRVGEGCATFSPSTRFNSLPLPGVAAVARTGFRADKGFVRKN